MPERWVEALFRRMEDRYGDLWANRYGAFPRDRVMRTWAEDLADLTGDELALGVAACRSLRFPPNLPEFRDLCRPPIDFEGAFLEAVEQMRRRADGRDTWSSPAVFWAASEIGEFDLRNATWKTIERRWTRALRDQLAKPSLPPVPQRMTALPAPGGTHSSAVSDAALRAVAKGAGHDFLDWAKHPGSRIAVKHLLEGAARDFRLRDIVASLKADGVLNEQGHPQKLWDRTNGCWVPV